MSTLLLKKLFGVISRWRARRTAIRELSALNDRMLRDIGIDRSEIEMVVDELLTPTCPSHEGGKKAATTSNSTPPNRIIGTEARQCTDQQ